MATWPGERKGVKMTALIRGLLIACVLSVLSSSEGEAATVNAASCNRSDVQTAINSAQNGDTVIVPNGSCTWTGDIVFSKGIRLLGETKGSVNITHSAGTLNLVSVTTNASNSVEIANLNFLAGSVSGTAEYLSVAGSGKPALIHDNYFQNKGFTVGCIKWSAVGGVVWNNVFESLEANGSGGGCFQLKSESLGSSWATASTMGTADTNGTSNVYIENNTFRKIILQAIDVDDNMRVVIRYNTFDNSGFVYHGADTSTHGVRHVEVYNNTFIFTASGSGYNFPLNLNWWSYMRGGTGVWTDNVMPNISSQAWGNKPEITMIVQNLRRNAGPYPCWPVYPAPHQVGQSHNGTTTVTDPVYIWNNTGTGSSTPSIADYSPNECGAGALSTSQFVQAGRDFVVGTPKPGYVKYTYPHPLASGEPAPPPGPQPPAPSNLTVN